MSVQLEEIIEQAMQRVNGNKESDLCRYLPSDGEGHLHHFSLRKMKTQEPTKLQTMIQKFILDQKPNRFPPAQRKARRAKELQLTAKELDRLLKLAQDAGEAELSAKLAPTLSFSQIKRELINAVRTNQSRPDLWDAYLEGLKDKASEV